ncbi:hypothetical protein QEH56_11295 [Pelagicoccus enzymogenes]|uniref:hypothetical protein n=1 Tax=Pelagicoccus enzymogenes TaxID=2773457 RepID=UPI00280C47A0|nr:hypothetical protein [Pelagicoccus enzymogenes]MDQ8198739.1 hypothetical protein [Pelagicoccus enzymogenes]
MKKLSTLAVCILAIAGSIAYLNRFAPSLLDNQKTKNQAQGAGVPSPKLYLTPETPIAVTTKTDTDTTPKKETSFSRLPVNEVPGNTRESSDFLTSIMRHPQISLSDDELKELLNVYVASIKIRTEYEAKICEITEVTAEECILRIPKYPTVGDAFEDALYDNFAEVIGAEKATKIRDYAGNDLYMRNFGFGEAEQEIRVKLIQDDSERIHYSISHDTGNLELSYYDESTDSIRTVSIKARGSKALLPLTNLGSYVSFVSEFPKGGER